MTAVQSETSQTTTVAGENLFGGRAHTREREPYVPQRTGMHRTRYSTRERRVIHDNLLNVPAAVLPELHVCDRGCVRVTERKANTLQRYGRIGMSQKKCHKCVTIVVQGCAQIEQLRGPVSFCSASRVFFLCTAHSCKTSPQGSQRTYHER